MTENGPTVVVHVDDVGMCHGANQAYIELSRAGFVTSGSVMVPCPWFLEAAEAAADDPGLDLGVHLTLTAEKRHYKWRPLTAPPPSSGLVDDNGFFWPDVTSVRSKAEPEAAEAELRAQVERAVTVGFEITHLDAHMGAVFAPEFIDIYIRLGQELGVPILLTDQLERYSARNHLDGVTEERYQDAVASARTAGALMFDLVLETDWSRTGTPIDTYRPLFESIPPGLTFVALHPNAPGELDAIEPDAAHIRIGEYELFSDPSFQDWVSHLGYERCGMRSLRAGPGPRRGSRP